MKRIKIYSVALSVFVLALSAVLTKGQSGTDQMSSQSTKFIKTPNAVPNSYIVVLNDDLVSSRALLEVRRAKIKQPQKTQYESVPIVTCCLNRW